MLTTDLVLKGSIPAYKKYHDVFIENRSSLPTLLLVGVVQINPPLIWGHKAVIWSVKLPEEEAYLAGSHPNS